MKQTKGQETETEIATTRKLGPESETSSVATSLGDFGAVADLHDGGAEEEVRGKSGRRSVLSGLSASKTPGWWRMSFSSNQK